MADDSATLSSKSGTNDTMAPENSESRGYKRPAEDDGYHRSKKFKGNKGGRNDHHKNKNHGNSDRKAKGKDLGRGEYFRSNADKRDKIEQSHAKSQVAEAEGKAQPVYATKFSKDEITSEDRRPKRKVAVFIGYSGTGYKGMQIMPNQRTIEGDLFQAFVKAGAISKANADDPKKSQLVRCARTDKGVHAAGNMISLKLIIEDEDIVEKINSHLPEQIRVWGYERTTGSFSSYAQCDSRWYEYLIPTYAFLPPHPNSWMAKELKRIAEEDGQIEIFHERQKEVLGFWEDIEENQVKPLLEAMTPEIRVLVETALYHTDVIGYGTLKEGEDEVDFDEATDEIKLIQDTDSRAQTDNQLEETIAESSIIGGDQITTIDSAAKATGDETSETTAAPQSKHNEELDAAIKSVKNVYIQAKNAYRIQAERVARVKDVLSRYEGTHNYHNFTIKKSPRDSSAKRFIRSFQVNGDPVLINGTEWLSLKVHGQSFMMHQIRKMVAMVALIVRSGSDPELIPKTLGLDAINIPKAPGLGLLLERPVFESYNQKAASFDKNPLTFDKYEEEIVAFKQREIYDKIFQEEAASHVFHAFFAQVENYKEAHFLYLSTRGIEAAKHARTTSTNLEPSRKERKQTLKRDRDGTYRQILNTDATSAEEPGFVEGVDTIPAAETTATTEPKNPDQNTDTVTDISR